MVTIKNFSTVTNGLTGRFVRVAARYQSNGSLVAVRIWAANSFSSVWISPEGHVLHVNTTTDVITVQNELGQPVNLRWMPIPSSFSGLLGMLLLTPRLSGREPSFLTNKDLVRGFKIHASVVIPRGSAGPHARPVCAERVDIEIARYDGSISAVNANNFHLHSQIQHPRRQLHIRAPLHFQQHAEWNRSFHRRRDHRVQVVELHVPDHRG